MVISKKVLTVTIGITVIIYHIQLPDYNDCIDKYTYKLCTTIQCHMTDTVLNNKLHCLACIHVIVVANGPIPRRKNVKHVTVMILCSRDTKPVDKSRK